MMFTGMGMEQVDFDLQGMFEKILPKNSVRREVTVGEARKILFDHECEALLNKETIHQQAIQLAENLGIIFLDEVDKIVASEGKGADVSRKACNAICFQLSKARRFKRAMVMFAPIMFYLLLRALFIVRSQAT